MPMVKSGDTRSPMPGISPRMGSRPIRYEVPGTTNAESSNVEMRRSAASRCVCQGVNCRMRATRGRAIVIQARQGECLLLESPSQEYAAHGKSGAHRRQQDEIAAFELARLNRVVQRQRYGASRGISEAIDIDDDLLARHTEFLGRREDDPTTRLMGHEEIDV